METDPSPDWIFVRSSRSKARDGHPLFRIYETKLLCNRCTIEYRPVNCEYGCYDPQINKEDSDSIFSTGRKKGASKKLLALASRVFLEIACRRERREAFRGLVIIVLGSDPYNGRIRDE